MNAGQKSVAVAVGTLAFAVWGAQPLAAQERAFSDPSAPYSACARFEANAAAWDACMRGSASAGPSGVSASSASQVPADDSVGRLGRFGDVHSAENALQPLSAGGGALQRGSNPANTLCDSQTGAARDNCVRALSTGGIQEGAGN